MAQMLNNDNFNSSVETGVCVVDFFATWCGPCKMLSPILEQVADENPKAKILKVDIDDSMEIAEQYGIMSVPTLILFKDGAEVTRELGFRQKKQIIDLIEENS